jgi:hypothetical protein
VLMNTRGLMELIVLNVGLDLGVISPTLFTMLVLMAIVTTVMTVPLLKVVLPAASWRTELPCLADRPGPHRRSESLFASREPAAPVRSTRQRKGAGPA